jgi:formylglycine-generating enzyme required for sulfatase activity
MDRSALGVLVLAVSAWSLLPVTAVVAQPADDAAEPPASRAGPPDPLPAGIQPGERPGEYLNAKDGTVLVWIPAGSFPLESEVKGSTRRTSRTVTLTSGYFLAKHEVTWEQYLAFCRATGRAEPEAPSWGRSDDHPVVNVRWKDAYEYCAWAGLRLPSELEWVNGARAGSKGPYCFGDDPELLGDHAWYEENAGGETHPVGQKRANAWGLHGVHGNASEWCYDLGPTFAPVIRGGSWQWGRERCRNGYQFTTDLGPDVGFRPAGGPRAQERGPEGMNPAAQALWKLLCSASEELPFRSVRGELLPRSDEYLRVYACSVAIPDLPPLKVEVDVERPWEPTCESRVRVGEDQQEALQRYRALVERLKGAIPAWWKVKEKTKKGLPTWSATEGSSMATTVYISVDERRKRYEVRLSVVGGQGRSPEFQPATD